MSRPQDGRNMDQSPRMGGSVRRARELAEAGVPRGSPPSLPNPPPGIRRPYAPPGLQSKDGQISMAISRPTPVAQWPLSGPMSTPVSADSEPYRPPPGRSQPPQRPPRPSRVPSILDSSRIQDHTPVFQYTPQSTRASELSTADTTTTSPSRPSTLSSVGSIPDFPLPVTTPVSSSRKTINLGPPPSSRRGASSFYSTASFVSPIPEESPKTRSHTSYASSAAIPESFGSISPGYSPNDVYFDDTIAEESVNGSDDADESRLVRSASIGKRGKPSLVTTGSAEKRDEIRRPSPNPVQDGPFREGTGYVDGSSSSSEQASSKGALAAAVTTDNMLSAFEGASATDPSSMRKATPSPRPFRLSGFRRPPRLDIDAVRTAEARGSLTSLPDLIRRATRLASLMERGRRPASRFDDLDFPEDLYNRVPEKDFSNNDPKHQSGLSDMLAAFPPPASRNGARQSVARQSRMSWPLMRRSFRAAPVETERAERANRSLDPEQEKKGRRCCGLPLWGFLFLLFILVCVIAVAIVVPLEIFVIKKPNNNVAAQPDISDCPSQLTCAHGGTNVLLQGVCSCICSNGFTGIDCTIPTSQGCTTTSISTVDANINNVTIGQAIPRLIKDSQVNFTIPLVATTIQAKFNSANLSCNTENALVTFDGQALAEVQDLSADSDLGQVAGAGAGAGAGVPITLSVGPDVDVTLTLQNPAGTGGFSGSFSITTLSTPTTFSGSTIFATTLTFSDSAEPSATPSPTTAPSKTTTRRSSMMTTSRAISSTATTSATTSATSSTATPEPTATFSVTEEVIDFARVAVLFVFQEKTLDDASTAQTSLQKFFSNGTAGSGTSGMTVQQAMNLSMGGGNTIDLVNLFVDVGAGRKGGGRSS
ncbi:hypothetical protein F5B20DRAFT_300037 [Whalleya microplaca]|nr:hypothetical protein F5B20DRAFT_300037 [Whalleya microplaca]